MSLILKNVSLCLRSFRLEVNQESSGGITVVFGPSGSGKTSLLEIVAGLRKPDCAFIKLDDTLLMDTANKIHLPPQLRGIGYVPQDLALFPHLAVRQNIVYGRQNGASAAVQFEFDEIVDLLEVRSLLDRRISELSGGEQQRIALARALMTHPRILLLDEPLASLDAKLKQRIIPYLSRIRDEFKLPMLYVTHDRYEAMALGNEVVALNAGKVVRRGSVQEVFNELVAENGDDHTPQETVVLGKMRMIENGLATIEVGSVVLHASHEGAPDVGASVYVCIKADDVILLKNDVTSSARNHLKSTVKSVRDNGSLVYLELDCGFTLKALLTRQAFEEFAMKPGDQLIALVKATNVRVVASRQK